MKETDIDLLSIPSQQNLTLKNAELADLLVQYYLMKLTAITFMLD